MVRILLLQTSHRRQTFGPALRNLQGFCGFWDGYSAARAGHVPRLEGKGYIVKDGDVLVIRRR